MLDYYQQAQEVQTHIQAPLHLLLIEDSAADAELIVLALEKLPIAFTYEVVDRLVDCRERLLHRRYDALLSDYRLPGFTAYQALEILQQSGQDIPLILITGTLGEEAAVDCIKSGMTDYVLKDRLFRLPMVLERSLQEFNLRRQQHAADVRLQQQAKRDAIINRIVQAMRETLVLDEVMQTTADLLHEALQVDRCLFLMLEPPSQLYYRQISQATVDRDRLQGRYIDCKDTAALISRLSDGDCVVVPRITDHLAPAVQAHAQALRMRAWIVAPLLHQQNFLGGIALHQCSHDRDWTADEVDLVRAIANQCAIAIHQAQLFKQVQQQANRERLLNQISQVLNSSLDPAFILQEIVRLTGECFQVDRVLLFALENDEVHIRNEWTANPQVPSMLDYVAPMSEWFDLVTVPAASHTDWVFHVTNYATLPPNSSRLKMLHEKQTRSLLSVPIFIRDEFFGGLDLYTTTCYRTFSNDEIHLLQRLADETAIALYNAQSYERLEQLVQKRTQELENEKRLSDVANRTKSEFLTHMSHELRTPLTGVLGFANILGKQVFGPLNDKQKQYVDGISSCGQHLLDLINDLLDLSKVEAGKEELFLETVVVQEICEACVNMVQEAANKRQIALSFTIAPDITVCTADKRRLRQILSNLLSNAVKFTDEGSVRLQVRQDHDWLHFTVVDTGIGISSAGQARLFEAFQQLDGGLDRKYEGTGLGLTLARKLAQLHGGDISVTSEQGKGSQFTLTLPHPAAEV